MNAPESSALENSGSGSHCFLRSLENVSNTPAAPSTVIGEAVYQQSQNTHSRSVPLQKRSGSEEGLTGHNGNAREHTEVQELLDKLPNDKMKDFWKGKLDAAKTEDERVRVIMRIRYLGENKDKVAERTNGYMKQKQINQENNIKEREEILKRDLSPGSYNNLKAKRDGNGGYNPERPYRASGLKLPKDMVEADDNAIALPTEEEYRVAAKFKTSTIFSAHYKDDSLSFQSTSQKPGERRSDLIAENLAGGVESIDIYSPGKISGKGGERKKEFLPSQVSAGILKKRGQAETVLVDLQYKGVRNKQLKEIAENVFKDTTQVKKVIFSRGQSPDRRLKSYQPNGGSTSDSEEE